MMSQEQNNKDLEYFIKLITECDIMKYIEPCNLEIVD